MKNIIILILSLFSLSLTAQTKVVSVNVGKYAVSNFISGTRIHAKYTSKYKISFDSTLSSVNVVDTIIYGDETRPSGEFAYKALQRGQYYSSFTISDNDSMIIGAYGSGTIPVIQTLYWDITSYPNIDFVNVTIVDTIFDNPYYVSTSGNDSNDGLTPETAWQTIDKINATTFNPGDKILFKRGDEWRGKTIIIGWSGEEGNPITIGAYGTGTKPIFNGSVIVTDWTAHPTRPNIWVTKSKTTSEAFRTVVVIDDDRFLPVLFSALDADLEYCPVDKTGTANDSVYVYSTINPSLRVAELSAVSNGIRDGLSPDSASAYITIRDISFKYFGYEGIDMRMNYAGSSWVGNCLVDSCDFYFNKQGAVQFYQGHGNNTVSNCTATYCGNGFYANIADSITFINNTISNTIEFSQGVVSDSFTDGHAIGMWRTTGTVVEGNTITGDATGGAIIGIDLGMGTIRYNKIYGTLRSSIAVNRTNDNDTLQIYYNQIINYTGLPIWTETIDANAFINIYNNTLVGQGTGGVLRFATSANVRVKNNILYSNAGNYMLTEAASGNDVTSDYNLWRKNNYYAFWFLPTPANATTWAAWQATGNDANGVDADPLFTTNFTDLRLQAGSPAINAGIDLGLPNRDILGNPIVGLPDIGAYEKQ